MRRVGSQGTAASDCPVGSLCDVFLLDDMKKGLVQYGWCHPWAGAIPGQVVLDIENPGHRRKQAEQVRESRPARSDLLL